MSHTNEDFKLKMKITRKAQDEPFYDVQQTPVLKSQKVFYEPLKHYISSYCV